MNTLVNELFVATQDESIVYKMVQINDGEFEGVIKEGNRSMRFIVKPAKNPNNSRALCVLHGHGANKKYAKFNSEDWTVICPIDDFGTDGLGSWWLGENGDFFTFRLLQALIKQLNYIYKWSGLYFWGSSMGGYGAIAHGLMARAHAVYAHMPQVKLVGTDYTDGSNKRFYEPIFDGYNRYADLTKLLSFFKVEKSPFFFLTQNAFDYPNYVDQHFLPLIQTVDECGFAYNAEIPLIKGHNVYMNIAETVKVFDKNRKAIKNWRLCNEKGDRITKFASA